MRAILKLVLAALNPKVSFLAFFKKKKEPSPKANKINFQYYPIEFCVFPNPSSSFLFYLFTRNKTRKYASNTYHTIQRLLTLLSQLKVTRNGLNSGF